MFFLAITLTAGCLAEEDPVEETTYQALSSHWMQAFYSGYDLDIGSATNRTCYITGLKGTLGDTTAPYSTSYARVEIDPDDNHWHVRTTGNVAVQSGCISNTSGRLFFGYTENDDYVPSQFAKDISQDAHCFITEVSGTGWGWMALLSSPTGSRPGVGIEKSGGKVWMGMSVNENSNDVSAASATGVCVNIRNAQELTFNATGPGEATLPLPDPANTACGLEGIFGVYDGSLSQGFELRHPGSPAWNIKLTSSKFAARPICVK